MRRVLGLLAAPLAALSLAVTGCSFSDVDPDATVQISGRALDASGKPLAGARVLLFKQADIGEVVFGAVLAVGTLSTICLLPEPPAICREARTVTADDDGRYEFELKGSDTQGTLGTESTLNVVFSGAKAQGSTTVSFIAKDEAVSLPDARLWRAAPKVSRPGGRIQLSWSPLPRSAGSDATYSAQLFEADGQSPLWSQSVSGRTGSIDPRILEDQSGSVAVSAGTELSGGRGTGEVRASYLSQRLPVGATAGTPPSRGQPCAAVTGTAPPTAGRMSACAATDGDLKSPARLSSRKAGVVTGVLVDLGTSHRVSLVVARGFAGQFLVELSDDGRAWRTVATNAGSAAVAVPGMPSARFVRLRSPAGLDESLSSEVSVW
jgi:hypothetical protein